MSSSWPSAADWLVSGTTSERAGPPIDPLVVAGIPLNEGAVTESRYDLAPGAVRGCLERLSSFHGERGIDVTDVPVQDVGDSLEPPPLDSPLSVLLGGHNGITFEALRRREDLGSWGLLTVDAHHDVREFGPGEPGNGSPVRALVEAGLPGPQIVQVGIAGFCNVAAHRRWCESHGITIRSPREIREVPSLLDALARRCDAIYVDLDVDVLDRAFAPGCPGARPGGITPRELFDVAFEAGRHPSVRAVDIVEVDPERDVASVTVFAAATTLLEAACGYALRRR